MNGGGLPGQPGNVFYRAPDSGDWEDLERGYSAFLDWAINGDLQSYYQDARWEGWRDDVKRLSTSDAVHMWPPLGTAGPPTTARSRRAIPVDEMWTFLEELWQQVR